MITIVLADDHNIVRQGLRLMLQSVPELEIVGEAADGLEAVNLVERLQPNVLILDMMMPGLNGLEVTRRVGKRAPETRIIILSMHGEEAYVLQALKNGASGYVLKESDAADLLQALADVTAGRIYLSPPLSRRAIEAYIQKAEDAALDPYETLTDREREILQLAAEGNTNTEIADKLSMSPRTAETHRANMMRKLNLTTTADLIRYAIKRGILSIDD